MINRDYLESQFARNTDELVSCPEFRALEDGSASPDQYDAFIANVIRAHLRSPQIVAFLFALAPPETAESLEENMLEELGRGDEAGTPHPSLLKDLAAAAGLLLGPIEQMAVIDLRRLATEPLLYGTLKENGLAALTQVCAFEWMLSRTSSRVAMALTRHRGLALENLEWFTLHSEVDIQHAEEGLNNLLSYIRYYEFSDDDAQSIVEMALRENLFIKRYFGELSLASVRARGVR